VRVSIPRYNIRLVKESQVFYDDRKIEGARMVYEFLLSLGLHQNAGEEAHSLYNQYQASGYLYGNDQQGNP
jgi:hypothetical protein